MQVPSHTKDRERTDSTMTPMIDVVFLLLVFFVATASFQAVEFLLPSSLILAESGASDFEVPPELLDLEQVILQIGWREGNPTWSIGGSPFKSLGDVRAALTAVANTVGPDVPVILDVSPEVPMGHVIGAYDTSRLAGLHEVQFSARED